MLSQKLFVVSLLTYDRQCICTQATQKHQLVDLHSRAAHTVILLSKFSTKKLEPKP